MEAVDFSIALLWLAGLVLLVRWLVRPPKRRVWTEVSSTDVATTHRRVRRPR